MVVGDRIFAATPEGVYQAKLSDFGITSVKDDITGSQNYLYLYPPYPLPARDIVHSLIYCDTSIDIDNDEICVYDIYGQKVADKEKLRIDKQPAYSGILSWDCSTVPDGIYLIYIKHGTKTWTQKVIKSK